MTRLLQSSTSDVFILYITLTTEGVKKIFFKNIWAYIITY